MQRKISSQIDRLRSLVQRSSLLQVTATPYALYLQPEEDVVLNGSPVTPKRPKFTVVLPTHQGYVGGDYYFEKSTDPNRRRISSTAKCPTTNVRL